MPRIPKRTSLLLLTGAAVIACLPAQASARDIVDRFDLDLTGGYRVDQLDWNIAGDLDGLNPDIISELTWKDLKSYQISGKARMVMTNEQLPVGGVVRGGFSYGDIYSGTNQDSDYSGDGRTHEYSRSNNLSDGGNLWDASVGGGIVFFNRAHTFSLAALVGYSYSNQNLTITNGLQTMNVPADTPSSLTGALPPVGTISTDLDSTYESQWRTGWVGLDVDFIPSSHFDVHANAEYHSGKYEAEGDWNLRTDLQHPRSMRHSSDKATGVVAGVGIRIGGPRIFFTADYQYQKWQAKDGLDYTYGSDGSIGVTKLNEANWESTSINGGVTVRF